MNPAQRAEALRLIDGYMDTAEWIGAVVDLLRELTQEPQQTDLVAAADAVMAHQWSNTREAMDALTRLVDAAHAQPQAEPVAYLHREEGHADVVILAADWDGPCADCIPLYAHGIKEAP